MFDAPQIPKGVLETAIQNVSNLKVYEALFLPLVKKAQKNNPDNSLDGLYSQLIKALES